MSMYFITQPKQLHISEISDAIMLNSKMCLQNTQCGSPVITMLKNNAQADQPMYNWLHLDIDPTTGFMTTCFSNGSSNPVEILDLLAQHFSCQFFSELDPEYWGVNSFDELERSDVQEIN